MSLQCVLLVGGMGSRLGANVLDCPKPLLPVGGRPFLAHLIDNLARFGFNRFLLLAGYLGEMIDTADLQPWRGNRSGRVHIRTVVEPKLLGTGGALRHSGDLLDDQFLLVNGDSFFDLNYLDLATREVEGAWVAKMGLRKLSDAGRYGTVELDASGRIVKFHARPPSAGPGLVNGGLYWMRRELVEWIPDKPCSLESDVLPGLAAAGRLHGYSYEGKFIDIGIPQDLERAEDLIPKIMRRPALFLDRDGTLNHDEGYTHLPEEFQWIPGARETIKQFNDHGYLVFVVTNQSGIARAYYDETAVQTLHGWMNEDLLTLGAHIDDFAFCPHHPEGRVPRFTQACDCRKPKPGLIQQLMYQWPVCPDRSLLVGDKDSDVAAAKAAGIIGYRFTGGNLLEFVTEITNRSRRDR